jgi:hypothetical protein
MSASDPINLDAAGPGSRGPVVCGVLAAAIGGAMLIALEAGVVPLRMNTVLMVFVPGAAVAAGLIAVAMGWIFMAYGRAHRRPAAMAGAVVAMGVAVVELLTLILLMVHAGGTSGLGM